MKYSVFLFILFSHHLIANNYYVKPSGSDTNNGLSPSTAFLTLQTASDVVIAGDTVFVSPGTYAGFDHRETSGTAGNPIVFLADGEVLINQRGPIRNDGINIENADYIVIDGFTVNDMPGSGNGIRAVLADHILIRNNSCDNNGERGIFTGFTDDITIEYNLCTNSIDEHGIYVSNSSDRPIIRYNECYGNNNIGIHMNGDLSTGEDGIIHDAEIYGNIIHDNNRAAGINMDGCLRPKVYNNLIYNNHSAQGIALFQGDGAIATREAEMFNNTIIVPTDGRWGILLASGSHVGTKIYNNIIINDHSFRGSIAAESAGDGFESDYNIVNDKLSATGDGSTIPFADWQALGLGQNSMLAGSKVNLFKDPLSPSPNYELKSGSQAIDNGTISPVLLDLAGTSRPQNTNFDIGAYERIYCPEKRTLSPLDAPFNGQYYARDSIILTGNIDINAYTTFSAQAFENKGQIQLGAPFVLSFIKMGCEEGE
ncbi:right-handed parallel beta-helix repeat-containing protein [Portibacter lacus]|nr:right-handed parallel beta-helix repeat-containing protein [Portibacter lacus]